MGLDPLKTGRGKGGSEALVIPLHFEFHVGNRGIDTGVGVLTWERAYGEQASLLDAVGERLGYSLWELHKLWLPVSKIFPRNTTTRSSGSSGQDSSG
jgi:hypothetical protein